MVAYVDSFWLMLILTALMMPRVLLIKPPKGNLAVGLGHP